MRKEVLILTVAICVSLICGCTGNASPSNQDISMDDSEGSPRRVDPISEDISDYCGEWEKMYSNLNEVGKTDFERNGVEFPVSQPNSEAGYLLSESVVKDCESRIKIGRLLWTIIRGTELDADRKYANENSQLIVSVLLKIWNSPGFSRDGVHLDKYYLLNNENFNEEDNLQLLSFLIKKKKLNIGLVNSVMERPIRSLVPLLNEMLRRAEKSDDQTEEVYFAIMIEQTAKNGGMFRKLNKLVNDKRLNEQNRSAIRSIVIKFKKGASLVSEDIENLGLQISEHEENRSSQPDL